ncbi:acyltransferase [Pedobacter aquatilis]|uniref:acyltransferase family protein n=1 Tax=Pedobacter aquatilis TaxID=351343 RepID=UPI00292E3320|nr:acyltransferase [Pedobacter aquatilis]
MVFKNKFKQYLQQLNKPFSTPEFLNSKHIPSLDGWRAVAIMMVILGHFMLTLEKGGAIHTILKLTAIGNLGVKIFFVLSGFLITTLLIKEKIKYANINLKNFFIRRALRIIPVLYLYLIAVFLVNYLFNLNLTISNFIGPLFYVNNFNFLSGTWITQHTWSLAVEEQFYLVWPAIFKYSKNRILTCIIIILIIPGFVIVEYLDPEVGNYILAPFFIPASSIFMGALISLLSFNSYISSKFLISKNFKFGIFIFAIVLIYSIYYFSAKSTYAKFILPFGNILTDFCFIYIILFSIIRKDHFIFKVLNSRIFIQIGIISYSLYIWQQLFIIPKGNYPILEHYIYFPYNLISVFIFGFLSFYLFEKPFLKLKERFSFH